MKKLQLSIYINEADRKDDLPLAEFVMRRLLRAQVSGATVVRGTMGFGQHGTLHHSRLFGVSDDRPVVITAVDDEWRLRPLLPEIRSYVPQGLITLLEVEII